MQCPRFLRTMLLSFSLIAGMNSTSKASVIVKDPEPVIPLVHQRGGYGDYLSAYYAAQTDDNVTAAKFYNNVFNHDLKNTDARERAFYYSVIAGNPAAVNLAKQEDKDPISALVLRNDAIVKGNWKEALKYFTSPPGDPLGQMTFLLLQAWCLYGAGQIDQANALFEKGINTPISGVFLIHYGVAETLSHHDKKAGILFEKAYRVFPGADLLLMRAYGNWLYQHHRAGKAEAMVDNLTDILPFLSISKNNLRRNLSQFPVHDAQGAVAQVYLAMASLIQQDLANQTVDENDREAKISYKVALHTEQIFLRFALQLNPNLSEAKIMLSGILAEQKHPEQARQILFPVNPDDPLKTNIQLQLARYDALLKHYSRAEKSLEELLKDYPQEISLWQTLGDIYFDQKNYPKTIQIYSKVIQLKKNKTKYDWIMFFIRGVAYEKQKQWLKAEQDLQMALKLAPNEPILLNYLGYSWALRHKNLQKAQIMLQKAIDIAPDEGAIRDSLGWIMVLNNQTALAIQQLELAAETIPQDPELNYHLGVAYWKVGRYQEAINQWNVALTCNPNPENRNLILNALQKAKKNKFLSSHH